MRTVQPVYTHDGARRSYGINGDGVKRYIFMDYCHAESLDILGEERGRRTLSEYMPASWGVASREYMPEPSPAIVTEAACVGGAPGRPRLSDSRDSSMRGVEGLGARGPEPAPTTAPEVELAPSAETHFTLKLETSRLDTERMEASGGEGRVKSTLEPLLSGADVRSYGQGASCSVMGAQGAGAGTCQPAQCITGSDNGHPTQKQECTVVWIKA